MKTLKNIYTVLLEIRDLLKLAQGDANAMMLTIDLISRNPKLQPLVTSHNARAEGAPQSTKYEFVTIQTIQRKYGIDVNALKYILTKMGIEFGTHFFKETGRKGHVMCMIRRKDLPRVEEALKKKGYPKNN